MQAFRTSLTLTDRLFAQTRLNTKLHLMSTNSPVFWVVVCVINVWKEMGWDAIIYLSAMAGIDQGLYEAAGAELIEDHVLQLGESHGTFVCTVEE